MSLEMLPGVMSSDSAEYRGLLMVIVSALIDSEVKKLVDMLGVN